METLFDLPPISPNPDFQNKNPMVRLHGKFNGKQCKDCIYLYYHETAKRYYKCKCRPFTRGPGTDHFKKWDACKLFKEDKP